MKTIKIGSLFDGIGGFPDNWTEGHSDSARYKALGNSVAVPCVEYIMRNIADLLT